MSETTGPPAGGPSSRWEPFTRLELATLICALRDGDHNPVLGAPLLEQLLVVHRARVAQVFGGRLAEVAVPHDLARVLTDGLAGGSGPACEVVEHHVDPRLAERLAERLGPPRALDTAKAGPEGTGPCHLRPGDHTPVPGRRDLLVLGDPVVVDGADVVRVVTHGGRSELIFRHVVRVEIHATSAAPADSSTNSDADPFYDPGEHGC